MLGLVECALAVLIFLTAVEENRGNGIPRWTCSEGLQALLVVAFFAVPIAALVLAIYRGVRR